MLGLASAAEAQTGIGSATTVERDVSGQLAGRNRAIAVNDDVYSSETIRTANESATKLVFLDDTTISIGPSASVVLDRFVYNPDRSARAAVVRISQGAMRWVSGVSNKRAYEIRTPLAVLGVRGTVFDLVTDRNELNVTLQEGEITVCPVRTPRRCIVMNVAGQSLRVTRRGVEGPRLYGPAPGEFAAACLAAIDRGVCNPVVRTQPRDIADFAPPAGRPLWSGFYAGFHTGYGRQETRTTIGGFGPRGSIEESIRVGNVPRRLGADNGGGVAGLQAGFNMQSGPLVFGIEADYAFTGLATRVAETRANVFAPAILITATSDQYLDSLGTVRGRVGAAFGNLLLFATGGLAYGEVQQRGTIVGVLPGVGILPSTAGSRSDWRAGWALGGGVEVAIGPQLSLKLDYLHFDLGTRTTLMPEFTGQLPGEFATERVRVEGDLVRAGLNYRF